MESYYLSHRDIDKSFRSRVNDVQQLHYCSTIIRNCCLLSFKIIKMKWIYLLLYAYRLSILSIIKFHMKSFKKATLPLKTSLSIPLGPRVVLNFKGKFREKVIIWHYINYEAWIKPQCFSNCLARIDIWYNLRFSLACIRSFTEKDNLRLKCVLHIVLFFIL